MESNKSLHSNNGFERLAKNLEKYSKIEKKICNFLV